jgi:hypothetical protein
LYFDCLYICKYCYSINDGSVLTSKNSRATDILSAKEPEVIRKENFIITVYQKRKKYVMRGILRLKKNKTKKDDEYCNYLQIIITTRRRKTSAEESKNEKKKAIKKRNKKANKAKQKSVW